MMRKGRPVNHIEQASARFGELRRSGLSIESALDEMKGKNFGMVAIYKALTEHELMSPEDIKRLFDKRKDYRDL
jgi:hypothetical protein